MGRTPGAKNRSLREVTKDSTHAIERKRLKDQLKAAKERAKDAEKRAKKANKAAVRVAKAK